MRYVITYINITKEKRYCYVIVILNIGKRIGLRLTILANNLNHELANNLNHE